MNKTARCLAFFGVAFLFAAGCGKEAENNNAGNGKKMLPVAVRTAIASMGEISENLQFTGELESPLTVRLSTKVQGRLEKLALENGTEVTEGVEVKRGEIVAEIDHRDLEAQLSLARAQVQQTKVALADKERERRRLEALFGEEVATEQARDTAVAAHESAKASLEQAEAHLKLAQVNLEESFIRAPMDGVVAERYVDPGAMVGANTPILRLVQMTPLRLMVAVPARMLPALTPGKTAVEVKTDVYPDRVFKCVVSRIFPTVDATTRTAPVEILLDNKHDDNGTWVLRPGMYATVEVPVAMRQEALQIPAQSIVRVVDKQIVFILEGDTARSMAVKTGIRSGVQVEILEGLKQGDEYVTMGQNKLTDGVTVERVKEDVSAGGVAE